MRTDYEQKAPLGDFLIKLKAEGLSGAAAFVFAFLMMCTLSIVWGVRSWDGD